MSQANPGSPLLAVECAPNVGVCELRLEWAYRDEVRTQPPEVPLPRRTVFSVEPGIYLENETGVRIEDLVAIDVDAGSMDLLTKFPRDAVVVGV